MRTEPAPRPAASPARPSPAIDVEISDTQRHLAVDPDRTIALVRRALEIEGVASASISIAIVDDATIRPINARHLGHDWPTDVISFGLSEPGDPSLVGELVVSAEMAARSAAEVGADPSDELALYLVHGLLHLCGRDDAADGDRAAMRAREAEILAALGRANPFGPVAVAGREVGPWTS